MKKIHLLILLMVVLGVASVTSGCVAANKDGTYRPGWLPANSSSETVTETPTPTLTYVTIATPYPTTAVITGLPTSTLRPSPPRNASGDEYLEIFNSTLYFDRNDTAMEYDLVTPPLIIDYLIIPEISCKEEPATSEYGSRETITVTKCVPISTMDITIRNKDTSAVIYKSSYGVYKEGQTADIVKIYSPGRYHLELKGGLNVKVNLILRVRNS